MADYDALLVVSFGGPEGMSEVMPFLENVLRGTGIPRERMLEVAEHYRQFDGVSPLNAQNRALIAALKEELNRRGPRIPIYWGNRNWSPFFKDTLQQMTDEGLRRVLAFFPSAYSSYSGCRQYREEIELVRAEIGPNAPEIHKLRNYYNHPSFVAANAARIGEAVNRLEPHRRKAVRLVFTAHSLPLSMASGCDYEAQLRETSRLVAAEIGNANWGLVYQSRSGPPHQPWLEPDICDYLERLRKAGVEDVVVAPIGFISDHLEVIYDLDTEAAALSRDIGLNMVRAPSVGTHPLFVSMVRDLIFERMSITDDRPALGSRGPAPDFCPSDCCPYVRARPASDAR